MASTVVVSSQQLLAMLQFEVFGSLTCKCNPPHQKNISHTLLGPTCGRPSIAERRLCFSPRPASDGRIRSCRHTWQMQGRAHSDRLYDSDARRRLAYGISTWRVCPNGLHVTRALACCPTWHHWNILAAFEMSEGHAGKKISMRKCSHVSASVKHILGASTLYMGRWRLV
jgi:hypothetical protein